MPGHLFIVQGDLTRLACDAWLLPTGRSLQIRNHWLRDAPVDLLERVTKSKRQEDNVPSARRTWVFRGAIEAPHDWVDGDARTFEMREWITPDGANRAWPTGIVVMGQATDTDQAAWAAEGARQFIERAAASLENRSPAHGRHRHLLALPVVGTGAGGGWAVAGSIVRQLISVLDDAVRRIEADVVLVTRSRDQFAAAQHARRELSQTTARRSAWSDLADRLLDAAKTLAAYSAAGDLVLFLGAGVSVGAGLPTWQQLLDGLADDAKLDARSRAALKELPAVDQARFIQDRLERPASGARATGTLADAVCSRVASDRYGLMHAILSNLPAKEAVTTNYDTLFEDASGEAGISTAVLPYSTTCGAQRWLLKLHGCVNHPRDIVLTREDFLRYADRRGALAGIVQALLITRHMLFVGFSLEDDNFQRIADEVRKAVRLPSADGDAKGEPFGTALLLDPPPLLADLWRGDINCVTVAEERASDIPLDQVQRQKRMAAAARDLEIVLDYVVLEAARHVSHVLDPRYDGMLSEDEKALRAELCELQRMATPSIRSLPAWKPIEEMLAALGASERL